MKPLIENAFEGEVETPMQSADERKLKTAELIDVLKENYAAFVSKREILLMVIDDDFRVKYMSHTLCDTLHRPESEIFNESLLSIVNAETSETIKAVVKNLHKKHRKKQTVKDFIIYCLFNYENFYDGIVINLKDDHRVGGYLLYLHDVSERRKTEIQLKDLSLELDSFVYKASHDLRAPLTSLAGLINITEMDFPIHAKENFDMMKKSVGKLDKFIRQLAHYSRNNNIDSEHSEIDFYQLINEIIDNHRHLKGVDKINFEIAKDFNAPLFSDLFRLTVVMSNLISNAIKYHNTEQGAPFIIIKAIANDSSIFISIEDNGCGINEAYISSIFEMFKRATDTSDGSGLGLYIVKKALEKLNGKITVESQQGVGTKFLIELPNLKNNH